MPPGSEGSVFKSLVPPTPHQQTQEILKTSFFGKEGITMKYTPAEEMTTGQLRRKINEVGTKIDDYVEEYMILTSEYYKRQIEAEPLFVSELDDISLSDIKIAE